MSRVTSRPCLQEAGFVSLKWVIKVPLESHTLQDVWSAAQVNRLGQTSGKVSAVGVSPMTSTSTTSSALPSMSMTSTEEVPASPATLAPPLQSSTEWARWRMWVKERNHKGSNEEVDIVIQPLLDMDFDRPSLSEGLPAKGLLGSRDDFGSLLTESAWHLWVHLRQTRPNVTLDSPEVRV